MEIGGLHGIPFNVLAMFDRVHHPPRGRDGGMDGWAGKVLLASGKTLNPKGEQTIPRNERLCLELPGGGGFGDPLDREPELIAEDVRNEMVSSESALQNYRVSMHSDGTVNTVETAKLRANSE